MKAKAIVLTLAAGIITLGWGAPGVLAQGPPPGYGSQAYGYRGQEAWEAPPSEYQEVARRGFHDGIEGARKDYANHRRPDVNNRDEFRHPDDVPKHDRHDYREAFRRGYQEGVEHLYGEGPRRY
ncbi:MAG: hypothetical protein ACR2JE_12165 [Acidobacteriaceae bacterium]